MAALASVLGLSASPSTPYLTSHYAIAHFILAYALLSTRPLKIALKLDHQVSPREDLTKYGPSAVQSGKISQKQLDLLKRNESTHANSVEHWPVFVGAMVFATFAGVPAELVNRVGLAYTVIRVVYAGVYLAGDTLGKAAWRGPVWWAGNVVCLWLWWRGGKELNATRL